MKINNKAFGLATGIFCGLAFFLVTNALLINGGPGEHIRLLGAFCFGYSYSFIGSIIGLIWGFVYGFISGLIFAFLYNRIAR